MNLLRFPMLLTSYVTGAATSVRQAGPIKRFLQATVLAAAAASSGCGAEVKVGCETTENKDEYICIMSADRKLWGVSASTNRRAAKIFSAISEDPNAEITAESSALGGKVTVRGRATEEQIEKAKPAKMKIKVGG